MVKKIIIFSLFILILISLGGIVISNEIEKRDIPSPLNPSYIEKIANCGKLDLIDRTSPKYNPKALTDGSLTECHK